MALNCAMVPYNKEMTFSVVLIGCNQRETVCRAVESVLQQTYRDVELIYVDDASTDGSAELVGARFDDSRLRMIRHAENAGCVISRLDGAAAARGDWLLFLDGDDSFRAEACEVLSDTIQNAGKNADVIGFGTDILFAEDAGAEVREEILRLAAEPCLGPLSGEELMDEMFLKRSKAWLLWNKCYAKELVDQAISSAARERIVHLEDYYLSFLLGSRAKRYYGIPAHLHRYHFGVGVSSAQRLQLPGFRNYLTGANSPRLTADYAWREGLFDRYQSSFEMISIEVMLGAYYKLLQLPAADQAEAARLFVEAFGESFQQLHKKAMQKNAAIEESRRWIEKLDKDIAEKDAAIEESRRWIEKLDRDIAEKDAAIEDCWLRIERHGRELAEKDTVIAQREKQLAAMDAALRETQEALRTTQERLQRIYASKWYRAGKRLRAWKENDLTDKGE